VPRNETGLDVAQATCEDFLEILWGAGDLGELRLDPDRALAQIREAIRRGRTADARARIADELTLVGPAITYRRYFTPAELAHQPQFELIHRYAAELSTLGGKLELDAGEWDAARDHLLRAIIAAPRNLLPRAHLIQLYVETKAYRAAREVLEEISSRTALCPELFRLGVDILTLGERGEARRCFRRVAERDEVGTFRVLAQRLLERTVDETPDWPSPEALEDLLDNGTAALRLRERARAVEELHKLLMWSPRSEQGWLALGLAYQLGIDEPNADDFGPNVVSDRREVELRRAEEALWLASSCEPRLVEAQIALSSVRLELDLPGAALEAARAAMQFAGTNAEYLGPLSQLLLQNRLLKEAQQAARAALRRDPNDNVARATLAQLQDLFDNSQET
jgi:tetratricopeptide (TPR) repeat protein